MKVRHSVEISIEENNLASIQEAISNLISKYKITSNAKLIIEDNFDKGTSIVIYWEDTILLASKDVATGSHYKKWAEKSKNKPWDDISSYHK